jgi:hypothetical protein
LGKGLADVFCVIIIELELEPPVKIVLVPFEKVKVAPAAILAFWLSVSKNVELLYAATVVFAGIPLPATLNPALINLELIFVSVTVSEFVVGVAPAVPVKVLAEDCNNCIVPKLSVEVAVKSNT